MRAEIAFKWLRKNDLARPSETSECITVSGIRVDSARKVIGLYRMRADWTIKSVAGIEPGARSIQRLERSRPCLRRTRPNYGF